VAASGTQSGTDALEALFRAQGSTTRHPNPRKRKRGRGAAIVAWIIGVLIVLLVAAFIIVDSGLRSTAETIAASAVKQALPDGVISGPVSVHIGGPSVIFQYIAGSFDDVEVDVHTLTVAGISAPARITAHGVPTSLGGKVNTLTVALDLNAAALTPVMAGHGTVTALGDGTLTVTKDAVVTGVPVTAQTVEKPAVASGALTLTTTDVQITTAPDGADTAALAQAVRGTAPATVCVADKLPAALPLTGIAVKSGTATLTLTGTNVAISGALFTGEGTC
jgi:hypothetical protein